MLPDGNIDNVKAWTRSGERGAKGPYGGGGGGTQTHTILFLVENIEIIISVHKEVFSYFLLPFCTVAAFEGH